MIISVFVIGQNLEHHHCGRVKSDSSLVVRIDWQRHINKKSISCEFQKLYVTQYWHTHAMGYAIRMSYL